MIDNPETPKIGRPTIYSVDICAEICTRLACGESLNRICKDPHLPSINTVYRWLMEKTEFRENYAQAREDQTDTLADEALYIADTPQIGEVKITKADGKVEIRAGDMTQHRALQIETRKWFAAVMRPRKYGRKVEHSGAGGGPIIISKSDADL